MTRFPLTDHKREDLARDIVRWNGDILSSENLCALHDLTPDQLSAYLEDPEFEALTERIAVGVKLSGSLVEEKALALIERVVDLLTEKLRAGEMSATTAAKIGDFALAVSGLKEKRAARGQTVHQPNYSLTINMGGYGELEKPLVFETPRVLDVLDVESSI